jgi:hypothetical protein
MKNHIVLSIALVVFAMSVTTRARAEEIDIIITIPDSGGGIPLDAHGQIDVENGYAVSGYWDLDSSIGGYKGGGSTWAIYPYTGPGIPLGYTVSPKGAYYYDNAVYLNNNNPSGGSYATNDPLDDYGLLFQEQNDPDADLINLWSDGGGIYEINASTNSGYQNFDVQFDFGTLNWPSSAV